jgi:hypothetical protein
VRHFDVIGHELELVADEIGPGAAAELPDVEMPHVDRPHPKDERRCTICHEPLGVGERKVHRGPCARTRKTQLQKMQRWRQRRWR